MPPSDPFLDRLRRLNVYRSGQRRAPHKPLLLLLAIAELLRGKATLPFSQVETQLAPLLEQYAPPVKSNHEPKLPYWHLRSDGLWEIPGAETLPLQAGGFPRMPALRGTSGHLTADFKQALIEQPSLLPAAVVTLLDTYFPPSLHEEILAAVGLDVPAVDGDAQPPTEHPTRRPRDPRFRQDVLRAYEHRCALTGFRAALGGSYFGCEAAHIQWHAYDGPDTVDNGLAIEPTLHKLLDAGAWTLTDDRRVLVSADLTGTYETIGRIRRLHGQRVRTPLAGVPPVSVEYIRWHREEKLGGVFRHPALPLQ